MPVKIRLSRGGAKKRPYYRIVVADSRRSRDGKFIDQIGTYNPMLSKDNTDRVKIDIDKAKNWITKGAQPSDRVKIFLSNFGLIEKPIITEKTKKHLPKKKEEKDAPKEEAKTDAPKEAPKEEAKTDAPKEAPKEEAKTEAPKEEAKTDAPKEEAKTEK